MQWWCWSPELVEKGFLYRLLSAYVSVNFMMHVIHACKHTVCVSIVCTYMYTHINMCCVVRVTYNNSLDTSLSVLIKEIFFLAEVVAV